MIASNPALSDADLLQEYVQTRKQCVFDQLVQRYVNMVYGAALRQMRDAHRAEDVTQAVFLILSQRADSIAVPSALGGWLMLTTRNVARNALVQERRLKNRERKAAEMKPEHTESVSRDAEAISPVLDDALAQLKEDDRNAIILRYFQSKSHREVGEVMGVSEDAASRRVLRALDKLKDILSRRGVTTSQAALGAALPVLSMQSAPSTLVAAIHGSVLTTPAAVAAIAKPVLAGKTITGSLLAWIGASAAAVAVTVGTVVLTSNPSTPVAQAPVPAPPQNLAPPVPAVQAPVQPGALSIRVLDPETEKPLEGAEVQVRTNNRNAAWTPVDADGIAKVPAPNASESLTVMARAPGRPPVRISYYSTLFRGDMPAVLDMPIAKGVPIGGVVVDEKGAPVPEATVRFTMYNNSGGKIMPDLGDEVITTDGEGRWTLDAAPSSLNDLAIAVSHPAVNSGASYSKYPPEDLREERVKLVLRKAPGQGVIQRSGVVLDPDGKPVKGARVLWAFHRQQSPKPVAGVTDDSGKFALTAGSEFANYPITVTMPGYGPAATTRAEVAADKPITLKLAAPKTLQGTVTDENNQPLRGARVETSDWRLGNEFIQAINWTTTTDGNGQFVLKDLPSDSMQISISAARRSAINSLSVVPGAEPLSAKLYPLVEIGGRVIDVETKQPIPTFKMSYGIRWPGQDDVTWQSGQGRELANGKYDATIGDFSNGGRLRVEAPGYLPASSRIIEAKESVGGKITVDFEMTKGSGASGTLVDADGNPVSNVSMALIPTDSNYGISIYNPTREVENITNAAAATTNREGKFVFPPVDGTHQLIVSSDAGQMIIEKFDKKQDQTITLQRWGRVEGVWNLNGVPAPGIRVIAMPVTNSRFFWDSDQAVSADADGRFVLTRVMPGKMRIHRVVTSANTSTFLGGDVVDVLPGKTTTVSFGGKGRPVVGRINLPANIAGRAELGGQGLFTFSAMPQASADFNPFTAVQYPEDYPDWSTAQRSKWQADHLAKPRMAAAMKAMLGQTAAPGANVQFVVAPDGTFRADDVPAGSYQIRIDLRTPWRNNQRPEVLGTIFKSFVVPETPKLPTPEVLDLGSVTVQADPTAATAPMKIGEPLPRLPIVSATGAPLDWDLLKGKIVVVHTWLLDGRQMFPAIKQVEQAYAGDGRVVVLHVGVDMLNDWATRVAAKEAWSGASYVGSYESRKESFPMSWMPWQVNFNRPGCLILDGDGVLKANINDSAQLAGAIEKELKP